MQEREMTKKEKSKEKRLKKKYDDSDMKKSMKKQYGDDWKNVYYATIRKKAMENKIDEALKYEYMVLDQDGRVMGMATNIRDAEQNARGDNLLGITGRVVKLRRPMSQGRGDRLMGQLPADNLGEGHYKMPDIDRSRYTEMPGLEGPFQTRAGKVVYYDPKEGAYYDRDTDMYMTYDEFKALDEGSRKKNKNPMGPQGMAVGDRVEHEGEKYEVVSVDGDILTVDNLQNGNRTQFRMDDVTPLFGMDAMTDQDKEAVSSMFNRLKKVGSGSLKDVATEGYSPHKKGTKKYKAHMAAMHANSAEPKGKMIEGMVKVTNIKWDSDDDVSDLSTTMMVPVPSGMDQDGAEEFIADYITDKTGVTHDGFRMEESKSQGDAWYIEQDAKRMAEKDGHDWASMPYGRKSVYRQKAADMRKGDDEDDIYEAKKTKTVTLEDMRTALELDQDTTPLDIVSEYVKTTLDETFDTWPKVRKQVDYILAKVNDTTALSGDEVFEKVFRENLQSQLDEDIMVSENIDSLRDIVRNKSAKTVKFADGSMKIDMTTANIFLQAYDQMKDRNQEKISEMMRTKAGFLRVLDFIYGAMK